MSRSRNSILDSQIAYYDARAAEYESSLNFHAGRFEGSNPDSDALGALQSFVRSLPSVRSTLELGCGTGIWTRELLRVSRRVHAVDSSAKMIALNRGACGPRVTYECADIFQWTPSQRFQRVAAAFLLSHVPDGLLNSFLEKVHRSLSPQGQVLIIDEAIPAESGSVRGRTVRELSDGTRYPIVKKYRSVGQVSEMFASARYAPVDRMLAGRFFAAVLSKGKLGGRNSWRQE